MSLSVNQSAVGDVCPHSATVAQGQWVNLDISFVLLQVPGVALAVQLVWEAEANRGLISMQGRPWQRAKEEPHVLFFLHVSYPYLK